MIVYGYHPVREALRGRSREVVRVLVGSGRGGKRRHEIEQLCDRGGIRLEALAEGDLDRLAPGVHNGFVAELSKSPSTGSRPSGDPGFVVILEDVKDPRNLGALLRVCEGAGVSKVLIRDRGSAPLSAVAVKASAGATEWLQVERIPNTAAAIERLQGEGYWVYGADGTGKPPWETDLAGKIALCFGGEEKGLRALTRKVCDGLVGLPMRGKIESLNVSAAAAAVIYEAVRQRTVAEALPPGSGSR